MYTQTIQDGVGFVTGGQSSVTSHPLWHKATTALRSPAAIVLFWVPLFVVTTFVVAGVYNSASALECF